MLDQGSDPNALANGTTALIAAVLVSNYPVIQLLLDRGANVNEHDARGAVALTYAVDRSQEGIIDLLKKYDQK